MRARANKNPLADFNLNSIIVLVATAVISWLTTSGLSSISKTKEAVVSTQQSVGKIETAIPYINQNVSDLKSDLNTKHSDLAQSISEVKTDLKTGQAQTWAAIKDVRDEQTKVKDELNQVQVKPK